MPVSPAFRLGATTAVLTVLASVAAAPAQADASQAPRCQEVTVPVSLTSGGPADQRIAGTLCLPRGGQPATVQLLIPGGTYTRSYWSTRPTTHTPSYVEAMTRAGYATLAIDRLGTGRSSHPASDRFRNETHPQAVHELLRRLRDGRLGGHRFDRTILVGHSLGSAIATKVAIDHPDAVDGVVLTGVATKQNDAAFEEFGKYVHPANRDPRFAGRRLDDGYVTTKPGSRADFFFHRPAMTRSAIARDEATKDADVFPPFDAYPMPKDYKSIKDPVLVAVGRYDRLICGGSGSDCSGSAALLAQESPWYGPAAQLEAAVIPDSGHCINLQRTAPVLYGTVRDWADRKVGA
ncbi:alpha/beta fold hydrolase [Sphaerisporangium fuscum]|uniref:alpha/beta fold hydrolase n=1 Tax=Sphaerisporangium fuscum TaxID=2835868 RepID=UPI001BDC4F78|nr:alpha/beta fold hydrolase [Sphaerisporangium fuscum]